MTKEKKILFPKILPQDFDLSKRWFVEFYVYSYNGLKCDRKQLSYNLNQLPTVADRLKRGTELINKILIEYYGQKEVVICPLFKTLETLHIRPRSKATYYSKIKNLHKWLNGRSVTEMTVNDANDFIKFLFDNKKGTTVNNYRMCLDRLFCSALENKLLSCNPFEHIKKIKSFATSKMYFNATQITYLKESITQKKPFLWLAIEFIYYCFIRPKELRFLKIGDIDFVNFKICVRSEISKNGKTEFVNIPVPFRKSILQLQNYNVENFVFAKDGSPGPCVTPVNFFNNNHVPFLQNSFFGTNYSFYSWKHTGAMQAVKAGVNVKELQLQLRHHSLDQVNEYLKNMGLVDCEGIINKFPSL